MGIYKWNKRRKTLKQSQEFILEWTRKYKPSYNPIDEASFVLYLDAYGMIRNTFNDDYKQEIDNFIKNGQLIMQNKFNYIRIVMVVGLITGIAIV